MLFLCGCAGTNNSTNNPEGGVVDINDPSATERTTAGDPSEGRITGDSRKRDIKDHALVFVNGWLEGTSYFWDFFMNKVNTGLSGSVDCINLVGEEKISYTVKKTSEGFFLVKDGEEERFSYLTVFETAAPSDFESDRISVGILTDKEGLTAQTYFGGPAPSDVGAGYRNDNGVIVFLKAD